MITEPVTFIGPNANGVAMTPAEFDAISDWGPAYRFELIRGTLVVSPIPSEGEASPNDELGRLLRNHQKGHSKGHLIDQTLPERYVYLPDGSRRRADRVVWVGLGRRPEPKLDVPAIVIEFVSPSKRDWLRDYVEKRDEYRENGVQEYWVIDGFRRQMTVFTPTNELTLDQTETYRTDLLPGFALSLAELLKAADAWGNECAAFSDRLGRAVRTQQALEGNQRLAGQ